MKKIVFVLLGVVITLIGGYYITNETASKNEPSNTISPSITSTTITAKSYSYPGEDGKNALDLLKSKNTIEQDNSGLVTTINNTKANPSNKEYWAFYINGEMAPVGPQDYITKDTDKIEWRLEAF